VSELDERLARQARNEALFRAVNERIEQLGHGAQAWSPDGTVELFCECGEEGCGQRVRMPLEVYETPELVRAVAWTDDYVIVDKIPAAEPFVEDDPRGSPSS
jgi:hypothetical protein